MAKRTNGEGSAKWITKNGQKYWRITVTSGFDPLTGNHYCIIKKTYTITN